MNDTDTWTKSNISKYICERQEPKKLKAKKTDEKEEKTNEEKNAFNRR